jgi:hypothetical protein
MTSNLLCRAAAVVAGLGVFAAPVESQACCLFGHCHRQTTFFAPPVAAPVCNPCVQQTVNYAPQVAYRPLLTTTPVTACRPVTSVDPCTGCPTTVMRPTTAFVQRTMMVPYTTYRPVVQTSAFAPAPMPVQPACPTGACGATTTYFQPAQAAPMISTPAPAITTPGCCGATSAPAPTTFAPTAAIIRTTAPALTHAPAYAPSPAAARTASKAAEPTADTTKSLKPIPDLDREPALKNNAAPLLWDPQNKTTSMPNALPYLPVARKESTVTTSAPRVVTTDVLDNSGWEAAR